MSQLGREFGNGRVAKGLKVAAAAHEPWQRRRNQDDHCQIMAEEQQRLGRVQYLSGGGGGKAAIRSRSCTLQLRGTGSIGFEVGRRWNWVMELGPSYRGLHHFAFSGSRSNYRNSKLRTVSGGGSRQWTASSEASNSAALPWTEMDEASHDRS